MKLPYSWLMETLPITCSAQEYAKAMIRIGNAVEGYEKIDEQVQGVVVGRILSIAAHPNADSLVICQVDVGSSVVTIVTGAPNIQKDQYVPVALEGACLPGGKRITASKFRGELSQGMLCSGPELLVPPELYPNCGDEGILIFAEPHTPGTPVNDLLGIDETVIDYEILANRPDCLSLMGIARESAVALGLAPPTFSQVEVKGSGGDVHSHVKVRIDDPSRCYRYCARVVRNIRIAPSPLWMRRRLHAAGIRPINNIVDITNYVMLETGQPMHAFDLSHVRGGEIIVRTAKPGESIRTLDEKLHALTPDMLVIADAEGPSAIAGVMGGEGSEITDDTAEILFESACFDRTTVRLTGRALGVRTESSGRFERGVNVHATAYALERAAQLVELLHAGEVVSGVVDVYPSPPVLPVIDVDPAYIRSLTGVNIPLSDMTDILVSLGMTVEPLPDGHIRVTPPDYRQDMTIAADVAEEVLRVYGYDKLPSTQFRAETVKGSRGPRKEFERKLIGLLTSCGYYECKTYSFNSPKVFDRLCLAQDDPLRNAIPIRNPLSEDHAIMRTTLLGSMLQVISTNVTRGNPGAGLFEINARYLPGEMPIEQELPQEHMTLCLGLYGSDADFYALKGVVEMLLNSLGLFDGRWSTSDAPYLHPGRAAKVLHGDTPLCVLGEAHPDTLEAYGINERVYIAELDAQAMLELSSPMGEIAVPPRYQAVTRDMALVLKKDIPAGDVLACIKEAAGALVESVELFDVYSGAPIKDGYKSAAYTLTLRAPDHTLIEEEIEGAFRRALKACESRFDAVLRG